MGEVKNKLDSYKNFKFIYFFGRWGEGGGGWRLVGADKGIEVKICEVKNKLCSQKNFKFFCGEETGVWVGWLGGRGKNR